MGRPENLTVPEGEESSIATANVKARTLKQKISLLVNRLNGLPDSTGVYKGLARATAKAKVTELTDLLIELESTYAHFAARVLSLGEGLNNKEVLDAAVEEVNT